MSSIFDVRGFNANVDESGNVVRIPPGKDYTFRLTGFVWGPTKPSEGSEAKFFEFIFENPDFPRNPITNRIYYKNRTGELIINKDTGNKFWQDNLVMMLIKLGVPKEDIISGLFAIPKEGTQAHIGSLIEQGTEILCDISYKVNAKTDRQEMIKNFHRKPELVEGGNASTSLQATSIPAPIVEVKTTYIPPNKRAKGQPAVVHKGDNTNAYARSAELALARSNGLVSALPSETQSELSAPKRHKSSGHKSKPAPKLPVTSDSEQDSGNASASETNSISNNNINSTSPPPPPPSKDKQLEKIERDIRKKAEAEAREKKKAEEAAAKEAKKQQELKEREEKKQQEAALKAEKEKKKEEERKAREAKKAEEEAAKKKRAEEKEQERVNKALLKEQQAANKKRKLEQQATKGE